MKASHGSAATSVRCGPPHLTDVAAVCSN